MTQPGKIKPLVPTDAVLALLEETFERPIQNLEVLQSGEVALTFSFSSASDKGAGDRELQDYIIRFNPPMLINFEKEAYVSEHYASPGIPIPRVVQTGRLHDVFFAVTEKMPGQNLLQIPRPEYLAVIPGMIQVLDAIHLIPVEDKPGYGVFDGNGNAPESSWVEHLSLVNQEEPAGDFLGSWHVLFENSFLEREVFESCYQKMMELSRFEAGERRLVHGDFGFGNVLVQDGRITAVLDWMDARYGDPLYDTAWLDFWSPYDRWANWMKQHYDDTGRPVPNYRERILCCQCYITLNALKFYAKAGSQEGYGFAKERITDLLGE